MITQLNTQWLWITMLWYTLHLKPGNNYQRLTKDLLTKVYKYLSGLSSKLMNEVFCLLQNHYNLRSLNIFPRNKPRTKILLNPTVSWANQLWKTLPSEVKECPSLQPFKKKSKLGAVIDISVKFAKRALPM